MPGLVDLDLGKVVKPVLIFLGVAGGGYLIYRAVRKGQHDSAEQDIDNSPEANQADNIYRIVFPYGKGDLRNWTANKDESAAIAWASTVTNWDKVNDYYRKRTGGSSILEDVGEFLNEDEYAQFKANLDKALKKGKPPVNPQRWVIASPTGGLTTVTFYEDIYFKKPVVSFKPKTKVGKTLSSIKWWSAQYNKYFEFYFVEITAAGKDKGKKLYVLKSQVTLGDYTQKS